MERLVLTIAETAKMLGLSRAMTYLLARSGDLPSIRIGRAVRVPRDALEAWIAARMESRDTSGGGTRARGPDMNRAVRRRRRKGGP